MSIVEITIKNRIAIAPADAELICNNPTDTIKFLFDEEWADINAKTARFSWEGRYVEVPFVGNEVTVPEIYQTNYVHVGVYADEIASTPAKVKCKYSIKCLGGKVAPPAPDVYAQLLSMINELQDGADGISCTHSWDGTVLTVTSASGTSSADLKGSKGDPGNTGATGAAGSDGVGIASVAQTTTSPADGGNNVITVTMTNGTKYTFNVKNGSKGSTGSTGAAGSDGTSVTVKSVSESSADGGSNVVTFSDGKTVTIKNGSKGSKGDTGSTGAAGKDGATADEVIAKLPRETWTFTLANGSTVEKVVPIV